MHYLFFEEELYNELYKTYPKFNESWNLGPNSTNITVKEVVEKVIRKWGKGSWKEFDNNDLELHEANILKLDSSKIQNKLNWMQCLTIDEAIDYTVQWYKKFTEKNHCMTNTNSSLLCQVEITAQYCIVLENAALF